MMNKINSVCVYCASSTKIDSVYFDAARELGTLLGQRQIRLINGAGNMGLMVRCVRCGTPGRGRGDGRHSPLHGGAGMASHRTYPTRGSGKHAPAEKDNGPT